MSDPRNSIALGTDHHDVGNMDSPLPFDNSTLPLSNIGPCVPLNEVYFLHYDPLLFRNYREHLSFFPFFLTRNDLYLVIFPDMAFYVFHIFDLV